MSAGLRLYWHGAETRANGLGGAGYAPEATVVERVIGRHTGGLGGVTVVAAAGEQFLPVLSRREGALRFVGIRRTMATSTM